MQNMKNCVRIHARHRRAQQRTQHALGTRAGESEGSSSRWQQQQQQVAAATTSVAAAGAGAATAQHENATQQQ